MQAATAQGSRARCILRVAGVELEAIAEDHAQSDDPLASWWQPWHDDAPDDEERERRVRVIDHGGRRDGGRARGRSMRGTYLLAGGVDEQELDRLVATTESEMPLRLGLTSIDTHLLRLRHEAPRGR